MKRATQKLKEKPIEPTMIIVRIVAFVSLARSRCRCVAMPSALLALCNGEFDGAMLSILSSSYRDAERGEVRSKDGATKIFLHNSGLQGTTRLVPQYSRVLELIHPDFVEDYTREFRAPVEARKRELVRHSARVALPRRRVGSQRCTRCF